MNKIKIILFTLFGILIIIGIVGLIMGQITNNQCREFCNEEGALTFLRIQNGEFNLKDICICFFEDKIKCFELGK